MVGLGVVTWFGVGLEGIKWEGKRGDDDDDDDDHDGEIEERK